MISTEAQIMRKLKHNNVVTIGKICLKSLSFLMDFFIVISIFPSLVKTFKYIDLTSFWSTLTILVSEILKYFLWILQMILSVA